ncbi:RNA-directed DNA polymerase [Sinorhizobium sp. 8-89]|uniref:RNA-directed DNA polymerase n=1 Tax=Sinorhizobium sp. 7-81 TaxID=3049087 RepID=UPI0024C3569B|nr:RNA-directed DNA polymerase [Sinorhizobium sp. 7-81]MDK1386303.1 RNA-directed DNA polymerase [Sinorhizobium sp. 7-81]
MKRLIDLPHSDARTHLLKCSSYYNGDFPNYISFQGILNDVADFMKDNDYFEFKSDNPDIFTGVNYSFVANKDGRFAWRPLELMHPAIYVSLVNLVCSADNWKHIVTKFSEFDGGVVECCSSPVLSVDEETDKAAQITNWWQKVEQRSLAYSLQFSHILHSDVTDCYGSIYTHSIAWAMHGLDEAKKGKKDYKLLGNRIDRHIQAGRYGQTNGISQGSLLMDFIAEMVLGYVDQQISSELKQSSDFKILRYRDDYRIFANSDERCEFILKVISDKLRSVGLKLNVGKTSLSTNVVSGAVKEDKLAGIELQSLDIANAKTIQKQLLRLHNFGRRHPNSGALRRLAGELHSKIVKIKEAPDDLDIQVAIAADIALVSPTTFPAIAGILSHLIAFAEKPEKERLWSGVQKKMARVPHNGYLEVWLQRVTKPKAVGIEFVSDEPLCKIVNGQEANLWVNDWISSTDLKKALDVSKIVISPPENASEAVPPEEIELFNKNAASY